LPHLAPSAPGLSQTCDGLLLRWFARLVSCEHRSWGSKSCGRSAGDSFSRNSPGDPGLAPDECGVGRSLRNASSTVCGFPLTCPACHLYHSPPRSVDRRGKQAEMGKTSEPVSKDRVAAETCQRSCALHAAVAALGKTKGATAPRVDCLPSRSRQRTAYRPHPDPRRARPRCQRAR